MKPFRKSHENPASPAESDTAWEIEQFSEPRTMPAHWDLSELMAPANASNNGRPINGRSNNGRTGGPVERTSLSGPSREAAQEPPASMPVEDKTSECLTEWHKNMFADPLTAPKHWGRSW